MTRATSATVKQLRPMTLPDVAQLCATSRAAMRAMELAYAGASPAQDEAILQWLETDPANTGNYGCLDSQSLVHELSAHAMLRRWPRSYDRRGIVERQLFARAPAGAARTLLADGLDGFKAMLCRLSADAGGAAAFRRHAVNNGVDVAGAMVVYPDYAVIDDQLSRIQAFLRTHADRHPAFAAIVAYASICNLHPLPDGNGRLARMLYNLVIRCAFPNAFYLPIYEISALSQMGLIIRLRQADYHGQWLPLIAMLSGAVCRLAAQQPAPRPR